MPQPTPTLLIAEVGVALCALLAVLLLVWLWVRHWILSKDSAVTLAAARRDESRPWGYGLLQMKPGSLDFFPLLGLGLRPRYSTIRTDVEVGTARPAPPDVGSLVDPVRVSVEGQGPAWELCLPRQVYFSLRSWQESMPPGHNSSRVS